MSGKKSKMSSWLTPTLDDFGVDMMSTSSTTERRAKKRPRERDGGGHVVKKLTEGGSALWVDVYAPNSCDDLAVHKKKVQEVESWLVENMAGVKGRRFLLLTGPAGCGKTATIKLLAKEAGLNVMEWINPTTTAYKPNNFIDQENTWIPGDTVVMGSQTSQFRDFLVRSSKYRSVCSSRTAGNLVLVEDLPNAFLRDPSELHSTLRLYRGSSPVVFIVTDTTHREGSVKNLFPQDLQQDLSFINIQFNPIATGLLVKALGRLLALDQACTGRVGGMAIPTRDALQTLAETSGGDVRSAVNALQFATRKDVYHIEDLFSSNSGVKSHTRTKSRTKASTSRSKKSPEDQESLAAVGGKDASLFLFRALGKVLYCKRDHDRGIVDPLPKPLMKHERPPLHENPESIYDKASMGANSFGLFLHQNFLPFYSDVDDLAAALDYFTDSDVLSAEWTGKEVLEEYAASVAIRGLMHSNKNRGGGGGGGRWRPLTRPRWYGVAKEGQRNVAMLRGEHRMANTTTEELTTVMVPFESKLCVAKRLPLARLPVTRDLGTFSTVRPMTLQDERLDELDPETTTIDENDENIPCTRAETGDKDPPPEDEEEDPDEFRIDEFDD